MPQSPTVPGFSQAITLQKSALKPAPPVRETFVGSLLTAWLQGTSRSCVRIAHETHERFHGLQGDCIIWRGCMPPTERWPLIPTNPAASASLANFFSTASSPPATRTRCSCSTEIPSPRGIGSSCLHRARCRAASPFAYWSARSGRAARRRDPINNQTQNIHRESGRRVVERFLFGVRAVSQNLRDLSLPHSTRSLRMITTVTPEGPRFFWPRQDQPEVLHIDWPERISDDMSATSGTGPVSGMVVHRL